MQQPYRPDALDPSPTIPLEDHVEALRATFRSGRTQDIRWRKAALADLRRFLRGEADAITEALRADLGRPPVEAWTAEVGLVRSEVDHAVQNLDRWARPRRVSVPLLVQPGRAWVQPEPLGTVLILGPWNYPIQLVLAPLVAALAAGNTALLKPSELAPASAAVLAERLPRYLDPEAVRVVTGGPEVAEALSRIPFDHVFFTGGGTIGRKVMAAAAAHLTPVTLELGGKSPAIVDESADLEVAARRVAWGRFMNAGQTCVAPDYALVQRSVAPRFRDALVAAVRGLYGDVPRQSPDYGRIVSARHLARLEGLLEGQDVVLGGQSEPEERYLAPTIVWDPDPGSPLMQEEIFGPILPVLPVDSLDEAVAFVARRPPPLALYLFSSRGEAAEQVALGTRSGGFVVNDVVVHLMIHELPFGGVGASGMGRYHGQAGFETFSSLRAHLRRGTRLDPAIRYPPYGPADLAWLQRLT